MENGKIVSAVGMAKRSRRRRLATTVASFAKRMVARLLLWKATPKTLRWSLLYGRYGIMNSPLMTVRGASKGDSCETDILKLILTAVTFADIAENDTTGPATTITVALHTADPGEAGTQATSETAYTGYARVAVARTTGGWTVASGSASPVANIDFAECTAAPGAAITHFSVGTGTGNYLLYSGTVTPNITMAAGVIPRLKTTSTITEA